MQKIKSFIINRQYIQGIKRKLLPFMILTFVFIFTAPSFSTVAAGAEPLSVKVGAYANHPKIFMDDGRISGFWPNLMEQIAETENWKIEYIWGTWSDGLDRLKSKEIDIMPDVAFTEKRNKLYAFSEAPVFMSWTRVYVNKENTEIQSITDLKNKKIAALKSSVNLEGAAGLREIALGFNLNCTFLELDDYTEVFKALEENRADAGITNRNFGKKNAKYFKVKKTPIIFQPINMKFAFPKDAELTPYLAERINYHIKKVKQDENSIYYRLLEKYFEAEVAEKRVEVFPVWIGTALKIIAALFIFFILVIIATRIKVKRKTKEILAGREALQVSETRYRLLAENAADVIWTMDMDLRLTYVSPSVFNLMGYTPEEFLDIPLDRYIPPASLELCYKIFEEELALEASGKADPDRTRTLELEQIRKDSSVIWVEMKMSGLRDPDGRWTGILGVARDITDRKKAEEQIKRSLREKETLLAEIHHRVKNNMQIITSLLSLQSKDIKDERALSLIRNCEDRIRSMSLVHEKLYLSEDLSRIDFRDYMEALSARLFQVHRVDSRVVTFSSHIKDVLFNIETAIPLGLIANELISNAIKHAFPEGKKGKIAVELTKNRKAEESTLTVIDNGIGFPEEIDYRNTETFGLQLVDMLTEQLGGTVELNRSKGTSFKVVFKEQKYKNRI